MPGLVELLLFLVQILAVFFRDVLAAKGKGLDARQKLEKMRNLKVKMQTCHLPGSDVMLPVVSSNVKSY